MRPAFFERSSDFRAWLRHHRRSRELWVGFLKKATGRPSISYPEALDEALCWGWIDGVRRSLDAERYVIRFTPRTATSFWSPVNIRKAKALIAAGRMAAPGRAAFAARDRRRSADYSYLRRRSLSPAQVAVFRKDPQAWAFFQRLPPGYKGVSTWYVVGAKREDTQRRRLAQLIACSARGERLPMLPQRKAPA